MFLNANSDKPFHEVNKVGLAIMPCTPRPQNHTAILFSFGEQGPQLLHIPVPRGLILNSPNDDYLWVDLGEDFTDIDRHIICAHVQKVAKANETNYGSRFPEYGFDTDAKYIDPETGLFKPTLNAVGLTCATFVLEVFQSCGYELIDWDTWPVNNVGAVTWQKHMLKTYIEPYAISAKFLEKQLKNVGNRRYLPEEVVSSTQVEIPAHRRKVRVLGLKVRKQLDAHMSR